MTKPVSPSSALNEGSDSVLALPAESGAEGGSSSPTSALVSQGIERLVTRLREEGVARGHEEATRLRLEAEAEATRMVAEARAQAEQMLEEARTESERLRRTAEDAVRVAARDSLLSIKEQLSQAFTNILRADVIADLESEDGLRSLILAVAGRARESAQIADKESLSILLPEHAVDIEALRKNPETAEVGTLAWFVAKEAVQMLRKGVVLQTRSDRRAGIRVRADSRGLELALTEEDILEMLLTHLQPRFRALIEGLIRH